jgi:hypothetical protein
MARKAMCMQATPDPTDEQRQRYCRLAEAWRKALPDLDKVLCEEFPSEWFINGDRGLTKVGGKGYESDDLAEFFGISVDEAEHLFCPMNRDMIHFHDVEPPE